MCSALLYIHAIQETESYISELEGDNKVPPGKELVRPNPGFVAKLYKVAEGGGKGDKLFINIVSSDKISKPTCTNTDKGQNWSLPYSVGPPHMESDKTGVNAAAFDVCFHPEALKSGASNKRFRDLLVRTGIDGVQQAYKQQQQQVKLSEEFHVLKGVSYKQGQVPTMLIDKASREEKWKADTPPTASKPVEESKPPPAAESAPSPAPTISANKPAQHSTTVKRGSREPVIKKGFLGGDKPRSAIYPDGSNEGTPIEPAPRPLISELQEPYVLPEQPQQLKASAPPAEQRAIDGLDLKERKTVRRSAGEADKVEAVDEKAPVFRVKERGVVSMGDFDGVSKAAGVEVQNNRPAELVYTFELPKVLKPSKVQLDVAERSLRLQYEDVYDLSLRFAYDVLDKKGTAKYDKAAKTLTVTVPVKPIERKHVSSAPPIDQEEGEIDVERSGSSKNKNSSHSISESGTSPKKPTKESHNRWVADGSTVEASDNGGMSLSEEIAAKAQAALEKHKIDMANKPKSPAKLPPAAAVKNVNNTIDSEETAAAVQNPFIGSSSYVGKKKGYCYKLGDLGLGYYVDVPLHLQGKKTATAKPSSDVTDSSQTTKFEPFLFEYRQTKEALAVLVQVPSIKGDSVKINFSNSGVDVAFASSDKDGKVKFYSMKLTCVHQLLESKCKYDVASLNMVLALTKREPQYWREDKLLTPDSLTEFELSVKNTLPQPLTLIRLSEGSRDLQDACIAAMTASSSVDANSVSNDMPNASAVTSPVATTSTTSTTTGISKQAKLSSSANSGIINAYSNPPPSSAGGKMKFTVGALLDLD